MNENHNAVCSELLRKNVALNATIETLQVRIDILEDIIEDYEAKVEGLEGALGADQ